MTTPSASFSIPGHTVSFGGFYAKSSVVPLFGTLFIPFSHLECPRKAVLGQAGVRVFPLGAPCPCELCTPHSGVCWATGDSRILGMRHLESPQPPHRAWGFCLVKIWGCSPFCVRDKQVLCLMVPPDIPACISPLKPGVVQLQP